MILTLFLAVHHEKLAVGRLMELDLQGNVYSRVNGLDCGLFVISINFKAEKDGMEDMGRCTYIIVWYSKYRSVLLFTITLLKPSHCRRPCNQNAEKLKRFALFCFQMFIYRCFVFESMVYVIEQDVFMVRR